MFWRTHSIPVWRGMIVCMVVGAVACRADDWWPHLADTPAPVTDQIDSTIPEGFHHTPPDAHRILAWAFENHALALEMMPSCATVGTTSHDSTLGEYLAGLLQFQTDTAAANYLRIHCDPLTAPTGERFWLCSVMVHSTRAEMVLSQGISFLVADTDMQVLPESFRCPGAG